MLTHNITIAVPGTPQQLPGFRIMPGMEAFVFIGHLAAAADHIYLAKNTRPRAGLNTPGAGALVLSGNTGVGANGSANLDGDNLSQWWADADGVDTLVIMVYENRTIGEPFA